MNFLLEIKKIGKTFVDVDKERDFETESGTITRFNIGSFVNVTNVFNTPDIGFVSGETEAFKKVRLVDTAHSTRGTVLATATQAAFDIGRAKTRAFEHNSGSAASTDSGTTTMLSNSTTTDTTFKQYLFDINMFTHLNILNNVSSVSYTHLTLPTSDLV